MKFAATCMLALLACAVGASYSLGSSAVFDETDDSTPTGGPDAARSRGGTFNSMMNSAFTDDVGSRDVPRQRGGTTHGQHPATAAALC